MIQFIAENHKYESIDGSAKQWISVTSLIHKLTIPFNQLQKATSCSKRKPGKFPNKWYGTSVDDIITAWENESKRSIDLGTWYHNKIENQLLSHDTIEQLPVNRPDIKAGIKYAPPQRLVNGIYPEHLVYLESAGICGQSDIVKVKNAKVYISDHKTSKEIKRKGFTNWEGITTKLLNPVQHLDECEFNIYALQLSIYMYIILRHNPLLSPGTIIINHVKFKQSGTDKWGYPITAMENGEPVIENIEEIEMPYLKSDVIKLIDWIKIPKNR